MALARVIAVNPPAVPDYVGTYAVLELSGKTYVYEDGPLARWTLRMGGFTGLFLVDMAAASALLLATATIRFLHFSDIQKYGRNLCFALYLLLRSVAKFVGKMLANVLHPRRSNN